MKSFRDSSNFKYDEVDDWLSAVESKMVGIMGVDAVHLYSYDIIMSRWRSWRYMDTKGIQ